MILRYKPIANISEGVGGRGLIDSRNKNSISVQQFTLDGDFVDFHYSIAKAANIVNGNSHGLRKAIANNKPYKGYLFRYYSEDD